MKNSIKKALAQGLSQLIEGQKRFALEFGLNLNRVLPPLDEILLGQELIPHLEDWLTAKDPNDLEKIQALFNALVNHQIASMAAMDGIALHALTVFTPSSGSSKRWLLPKPSAELEELKQNRELRYQKLVLPGFVETYIKMREKFTGRISL